VKSKTVHIKNDTFYSIKIDHFTRLCFNKTTFTIWVIFCLLLQCRCSPPRQWHAPLRSILQVLASHQSLCRCSKLDNKLYYQAVCLTDWFWSTIYAAKISWHHRRHCNSMWTHKIDWMNRWSFSLGCCVIFRKTLFFCEIEKKIIWRTLGTSWTNIGVSSHTTLKQHECDRIVIYERAIPLKMTHKA